jgi:hypothetical protein
MARAVRKRNLTRRSNTPLGSTRGFSDTRSTPLRLRAKKCAPKPAADNVSNA